MIPIKFQVVSSYKKVSNVVLYEKSLLYMSFVKNFVLKKKNIVFFLISGVRKFDFKSLMRKKREHIPNLTRKSEVC